MRFAVTATMAKARRKSGEVSDTTAATMDRDRIAQRAYELYLARGCAEGRELDDWLCAERELNKGIEEYAISSADDSSRDER